MPHDIQRIAKRKLVHIHAAKNIDDLRVPPGNRLEKLGGDKAGMWSIRMMSNGAFVLDGKLETLLTL